jgi:hypothetical protein
MTISIKTRLENVNFALKLFLENLGNRTLGTFHILKNQREYSNILPTTWHELVNKHYLKPVMGHRYVLTGDGFRYAMELYDLQNSPDIQQMLGKLCKYLKDSVTRTQEAGVTVQSVAEGTTLTKGFINNAIEANLIEHWQNRNGASWHPAFVGSVIIVPSNFGLPRI